MNRLDMTTKTKAPAKKAAIKPKKEKRYFTHEDIKDYTSAEMVTALEHPASEVWMITGKEYGKNRAIALKMAAFLTEDYRAQGLMMKKYKTNAGQRLHTNVSNVVNELRRDGFEFPKYERGQNATYIMRKKVKTENQMIEYASFEDYDSIAGIEANDLGYFPMVEIDEPVMMNDDPKKIPSQEEWDKLIAGLRSSVQRSNTRHMSVFNREIPTTKYYYTMNAWDSHPLINSAEEYFPEKEFYEYIEKDFLNNHTMMVYVKEIDTLIVRGTKFGNSVFRTIEKTLFDLKVTNTDEFLDIADQIDWDAPIYKKFNINEAFVREYLKANKNVPLYIQAQKAIDTNNKSKLAEILGMKYEGEKKYTRTYDLTNLKTADTDKLMEGADIISNQVVSWDIDSRKGGRFVGTPVYLVYKEVKGQIYKNIVIGKQKEIASRGIGDLGQHLEAYQSKMLEATKEYDYKLRSKTRGRSSTNVVLDDNQKAYAAYFRKNMPGYSIATAKFKNTNAWNIMKRQSWLQNAIDSGFIICDEDNIGLISDLMKSICKEGSKQRDESGANSKFYDRPNSAEYGMYYYRGEPLGDELPGSPQQYYKEVQDGLNN